MAWDRSDEIPSYTFLWNPTLAHRTRKDGAPGFLLASGYGSDHYEGLFARRDRVW